MLRIDIDAMCKLAHWRILPLLPELTGVAWENMGTMASLRFRALRTTDQPDGKLFRCEEAARLVVECMEKMSPLSDPTPERLGLFQSSAQIDAGEAVLLALTMDDPEGCLLTGDKRALKAVSRLEIAGELVGSILVLEQIFLMALQKMGRPWILKNVCPFRDIDKAVGVILGNRCDAEEGAIQEGVASYLREIGQYHNPSLLKAWRFQYE